MVAEDCEGSVKWLVCYTCGMITFVPFEHTGQELRELADELWDRGFKYIADAVHDAARIQENHEKIARGINEANQTKEQAR